jgi:hypothetical protein
MKWASNFWRWFCYWDWRLTRTEWRVRQDPKTGLWHVEFNHQDQGWVTHEIGHEFAWQAAKEGRKEYEWDTR